MATNTNIPLATYTVTGSNLDGPTGVTFSIPSGYTDIVIKCNIKSTANAIIVGQFNGDTSGNYSTTSLGNGPATTRSANSTGFYFSSYAHSTTNWNTHTYNIMNYSNSTHRKTVLIRGDNSTYGVEVVSATWNKTPEPITSVKIFLDRTENFVVGSTFTVYGIAAEPISPKATGGTIYSDAEYFYHAFGATGAFVPSQSLTADILVVAGGGGGQELGGGAGAGGLLEFASQSLSATSYTVTVGAGGAGGYNGTGTVGGQGVNSQFGALTASVGGGGGGRYDVNGGSGGSGGGGGRGSTSGGANTTGQGSAGGGGNGSYAAGGGGGAGGAGQSAPSGTQAGNGGNGVTSTLIQKIGLAINAGHLVNGTYYYAGGGGGGVQNYPGYGVGGYGGGGRGGSDAATPSRGTNGMANTGGGAGGGSGANNYGGNGGSGVVIVRYLK